MLDILAAASCGIASRGDYGIDGRETGLRRYVFVEHHIRYHDSQIGKHKDYAAMPQEDPADIAKIITELGNTSFRAKLALEKITMR